MSDNMKESVRAVEEIIGYHFTDPTNLWEALHASGCGYVQAGGKMIDNDGHKRLALLGDSWLKLVLMKKWYSTGQPRVLGDAILQNTVTNKNLRQVCEDNGIERYIVTPPGAGGAVSPRHMYDCVEAIIGAVGEDGDMTAVGQVMQNLGLLNP